MNSIFKFSIKSLALTTSYSILLLALLFVRSAFAVTPFPATFLGYTFSGIDGASTVYQTKPDACNALRAYRASSWSSSEDIFEQSSVGIENIYNCDANGCTHNTKCNIPVFSPSSGTTFQYYDYIYAKYSCSAVTYTQNFGNGYLYQCNDTCIDRCPSGQKTNTVTGACQPINPKKSQSCPYVAHPISVSNGNKWLSESDYSTYSTLSMTRNYSASDPYGISMIGKSWSYEYGSHIVAPLGSIATVFRADTSMLTFNNSTGEWISDADIRDQLTEVRVVNVGRTGWTYKVDATGDIEIYDAYGQLVSITNRVGTLQTLTYDTNNRIAIITDGLGRTLHFSYDSANRISTMTNPAGGVYTYTYSTDGSNNLSAVTYPDGKTKTYLYGETAYVASNPNAGVSYTNSLTGIIDENNNRYATYFYDAVGRANAEYLAGNTDTANLVYNTDGSGNPTSTAVTDVLGTTRTYNFTTILGVVKSTGQSQPGGSGCAAAASAITYDANGNVASRTDFDGHKTTYAYDMARNLETSRTEGLTPTNTITPATRTTTTTWHATWRLPLVTTEYTGATATGTALHNTTNVYDTKGNLTSITETDPARSLSRTTTITYTYSTAVPGLVLTKVIDGPRTDVTDTTTYVYYPHDATCTPSTATPIVDPITGVAPANLGCRGQLNTVTNALGYTTTYNRYNHHGQVEQMTDVNGLITTNTYDLRQRLLTRTVSGAGITAQTTTLTYDNAGQVTQFKMVDNSTLNYTYDAAHRLTDIQDTLGNTVHYTLDGAGNRIKEETKDPQGNLAKTLTRSYDALNRLQQVTGVE